MKFAQIIEFKTSRIDEFNANLDAWMVKSEGHRVSHRAVLRTDRDAENLYLVMVEFSSYEQAWKTRTARDGRVRHLPDRDLRRPAEVPQPGRTPRRRSLAAGWHGARAPFASRPGWVSRRR